jgi:hypothetical protein
MTLILAGRAGDGAVLAADSRVMVLRSDGSSEKGRGNKLFRVGACVAASYGESPRGVDVPRLIRSISSHADNESPAEVGERLFVKIEELSDRGKFGVLILGIQGGIPVLCEICSETGVRAVAFPNRQLIWRGTDLRGEPLDFEPDLAQFRLQMLSIFQQAAEQLECVGPPFEFAITKAGNWEFEAWENSDEGWTAMES